MAVRIPLKLQALQLFIQSKHYGLNTERIECQQFREIAKGIIKISLLEALRINNGRVKISSTNLTTNNFKKSFVF